MILSFFEVYITCNYANYKSNVQNHKCCAPGSLSKALWGWIPLVQSHKCCAPVAFINSWCQREKLLYALLMRANKPKTAVQSSTSFFSRHHSHGIFYMVLDRVIEVYTYSSLVHLICHCTRFSRRTAWICWDIVHRHIWTLSWRNLDEHNVCE